ncbi:MAG TPA: tRNA (adenosine(37)-N6)-dimethylallyltransferase MiaA [Candidatus Cloacimonadota bacterium]|nr:tRNA (adenosine(37)-N6)-dimethylallyltransferase MiaA [Candidatus Cloacimonadota bacterium]HPT73125.1 tRNA (adenosine(37)-N6)-dimethylallyltransferase MiaA [Candidatus Cloacimonadota bacterium]
MIPIITIEGPTASGKSNLALALALEMDTEIISADSRQVYRLMDIGTSKPTPDELAQVKHHLIDILDITQVYTAGEFRKQATEISHYLWEKRKIPIIVGGTGLYVRSLLHGLFQIPDIPETIKSEIRSLYDTHGMEYIHHYLQQVDPEAAGKISSNDPQRTLRALEVWKFTGIPITEHWKNQLKISDFKPFRIYIKTERPELYDRIEKRLDTMMAKGFLQEIEYLLDTGYKWTDPGMNSVGYKEFKPYFEQHDSLDNCLDKAKQHTRNYAKRQFTWYNKCEFDLASSLENINIYAVKKSIGHFISNM